ncbi:CLP protease regulatory subunit CLPX3, mitochondrial [Artemisia annua]|uniref:CLP protease regulatory subunit CLPX3, mitochondrial n=1 Tax=Artemisia annua TaxID=35608 RepID=A0A2U1N513_ARTAN|nr:CLP protease regulatory subunit CLPX3, mitochondrial [Artemisia annua]
MTLDTKYQEYQECQCTVDLTEDQLVQVLMEPKKALGKQYKKLFQMNNVSTFLFVSFQPTNASISRKQESLERADNIL